MLESSHNSFRGDHMMGKGGDNGMKTVESLRGRLLSEREASKAAKNEADLIAKRLGELERQLAVEIKSRNRAEKRLQYALKKLQSLKRPNRPESSASSSEGWKVNSGAAANSSEQCVSQGEVEEMMSGGGLKYVARDDDGMGTSSGDSANQVASQEESWSSVGTAHSRSKEGPMPDEEINARYNQELSAYAVRESSHDADEPDSPLHAKHSDDTFALVPVVNIHSSSNTSHREINSSNVQEVLQALGHVKEQLRNSMGRRRRSTVLSPHRELYGQSLHPENPMLS